MLECCQVGHHLEIEMAIKMVFYHSTTVVNQLMSTIESHYDNGWCVGTVPSDR